MSFRDVMRNEFRFRKAQSRPRTSTKNMHSLEIYEALEARRQGLDLRIAKPLKVNKWTLEIYWTRYQPN